MDLANLGTYLKEDEAVRAKMDQMTKGIPTPDQYPAMQQTKPLDHLDLPVTLEDWSHGTFLWKDQKNHLPHTPQVLVLQS